MKLVTPRTEQFLTSTSLERACLAAHVATENKARDVLVLDMRGITPLYDFFVLATGASRRQIHTITEEIDDAMHEPRRYAPVRRGLPVEQVGRAGLRRRGRPCVR